MGQKSPESYRYLFIGNILMSSLFYYKDYIISDFVPSLCADVQGDSKLLSGFPRQKQSSHIAFF
jgi:hypothetical protein